MVWPVVLVTRMRILSASPSLLLTAQATGRLKSVLVSGAAAASKAANDARAAAIAAAEAKRVMAYPFVASRSSVGVTPRTLEIGCTVRSAGGHIEAVRTTGPQPRRRQDRQ